MHIDDTGFQYKQNPLDRGRAPKTRMWKRRGKGLRYGYTAKREERG